MIKLNNLTISERVLKKLHEKHAVTLQEVGECFLNRTKSFLADIRSKHATTPRTYWFIEKTNNRRKLKIVFIKLFKTNYEIKTAYEPNQIEVTLYEKLAETL